MKITVLGSAAAEGVPALWCECEFCAEARKRGGKNIRRRTSYLLDDDTLIDLGPDFQWQVNSFGIDPLKIRRLIETHQHFDHFIPMELTWRGGGYSRTEQLLHLYASAPVLCRAMECISGDGRFFDFSQVHVEPHELWHGKCVQSGDLQITGLDARHDPGHMPLLYLLERGGKKLLIGNDSGPYLPQTLELLAGQKLDAAFLECTGALRGADWTGCHMGVNTVLQLCDTLRKSGVLTQETKIFVNHFSHNGAPLQEDLEEFFQPHGIGVAFDGMILEI